MFTIPTIYFVIIDLKLKLPINVRRYFKSSKVRGEGNSVIFINWEILPGAEDANGFISFILMFQRILDGNIIN